jgi:hypothetical protein
MVHKPVTGSFGVFDIEVNVINFHGLSLLGACLSILTFFQDFQVIPKNEGTWFPLGATRMLRPRYRVRSEK